MSSAELLVTEAERAVVRLDTTRASRVWTETHDDITYVHATYGTRHQARAAALSFGVRTHGLTFPVRVFLDRHTEVVIYDRPRGAHRADPYPITRSTR